MRLKKSTFFILLGMFLMSTTTLSAQQDATIAASDIQYWVGEGSNELVFIVNWNQPDTALAWGFRFNGNSVTVKTVMDSIAAHDSRFAYSGGSGMVDDITFSGDNVNLALSGLYWLYLVNGTMGGSGFDSQTVGDGDYVKWGDESCATDLGNWNYVWTTEVTAVLPNFDALNENKLNFTAVLYPNPSVTQTSLCLNADNEDFTITICDLQGRVVLTENMYVEGSKQLVIDTDKILSGLYLVSVKSASSVKLIKLIVQ